MTTELPREVLLYILKYLHVTVEDFLNLKRVNVYFYDLCTDQHIWKFSSCISVHELYDRNLNRFFQYAVNLTKLCINAISCSDLNFLTKLIGLEILVLRGYYSVHKSNELLAALCPLKQLKGLDASGFHLDELFFVVLGNSLPEIVSFRAINTYPIFPGVMGQMLLNWKKLARPIWGQI